MGVFDASKLDKMKKAYRAGEFKKAYAYAEKLDPLSIKTVYDLSMLAEVYVKNHKYNAAKEIYIRIFEKNNSINVCKEIIKLCIKTKNVKEAIKYIKELNKIDPEDYERFIYQYKVGKLLDQPDEYLIECLKKVREADYIDKWALELARLYYANGMYDECRTECHNINLWFPESDYALKADALARNIEAGISYADTTAKASYDEKSSYDMPVFGMENDGETAESEESAYGTYSENEYEEENTQEYEDSIDDEADDVDEGDDFTVSFDEAGLWENYADDGEMTEVVPDEEIPEDTQFDDGVTDSVEDGFEETEDGFEYDSPEVNEEESDGFVVNSEMSDEDFPVDSEDWDEDGFLEDSEDWEDDDFLEDSEDWGDDDFLDEGDCNELSDADDDESFINEAEDVSEPVDEDVEEDSFEDSEAWEDDDFLADSEDWGDDDFLDEEADEVSSSDVLNDSFAGDEENSETEEFIFCDEEFLQESDAGYDYAEGEQAVTSEESVEEKENPVIEKASEIPSETPGSTRRTVVDDWVDEDIDDVNVYGGSNWAESLYEDSDDFAAAFDAERLDYNKNKTESLSDSVSRIMETDGGRSLEDDDFETTLINDSLTHDVIRALREQEENGIVNGVDEVDESILKMIEE